MRVAVPPKASGQIRGVLGRAWLPLDGLLDLEGLDEVHDEICLGLAQVPTGYTGGSHRSMEIMPAGLESSALVDYGEVIAKLSDAEYLTLRGLADDPSAYDLSRRHDVRYGEEREVPLSRRQMLWLEMRHGVYFPWKVFLELIPNRWWGDKAKAEGKRFTRTAEAVFPKTVALVKRLPFEHIGRCNILGLRAHDHGTVHRDGHPVGEVVPDPFITLCPVPGKRLYLYDHGDGRKVELSGRAYWFNDHDYHGVESDPFFRYSVRVDGVFAPGFLEALRDRAASFGSGE